VVPQDGSIPVSGNHCIHWHQVQYFYNHNRGELPAYNKEAWLRMMKKIRENQGAMRQTHGDAKTSSIKNIGFK
jgi:hypothetical protein